VDCSAVLEEYLRELCHRATVHTHTVVKDVFFGKQS
jgi:hypothetical protein